MSHKTIIGLLGFLALGLSPSFVDWQQSKTTQEKVQIIAYYMGAMGLIYYGVLKH